MGFGFDIGSAIGGIFGAGASAYGASKEYDIAEKNYKLQKKQFAYQKDLQQTMFEREDTAQQRAAADLEAAGLSKTLAAGSGASAGPVVSTQAPQMDSGFARTASEGAINALMMALQIGRQNADISKTQADTAVAQQTARNIKNQNQMYEETFESNLLLKNMEVGTKQIELNNADLDNQLKQYQVSMIDVDRIKRNLAVDAARLGVDAKTLEITAKQIAVEQAQYNLTWAQKRNLPAGITPDTKIQDTAYVGKGVEDILKKLGLSK